MAIYSLSQRTTNVTIANACLEIRTASTDRPRIMEIGLTLNAATASVFGLGRPQAIGITPVNVAFLAEDSGDPASTINGSLSWATGPTVPLNVFRRASLPALVGAGIVWTFPRGLVIPVSSSLVLWNISATGAVDVWVVVDE
ncbi:MAG TPA: hypothetical protein VGV13_13750 [Methylomirabilota bacterium]|jgi:hypothetical protein|nr:hypothetical protein [Methylomirabilota bacterium]